jgi:hypothetical protein
MQDRLYTGGVPRCVAALVLAVVAGCGNSDAGVPVTTHPVKGKVLLPDGKPLSQGVITFVPTKQPGREATAKIESDGTFTLTTQHPNDGAAEGDYRVTIVSDLSVPGAKPGSKRLVVNPKYEEENSSGLTATIKSGSNDLAPFQLDDKKPVAKDDRVRD